jgi:hypothetical protein
MDSKHVNFKDVNSIYSHDWPQGLGCCADGNEPLVSVKGIQFVEWAPIGFSRTLLHRPWCQFVFQSLKCLKQFKSLFYSFKQPSLLDLFWLSFIQSDNPPEIIDCEYDMLCYHCTGWLGYSNERVKTLCSKYLAKGFTAFKVKVGQNLEDDRCRCAMVREIIGWDNKLVRTLTICMSELVCMYEYNVFGKMHNTIYFKNVHTDIFYHFDIRVKTSCTSSCYFQHSAI